MNGYSATFGRAFEIRVRSDDLPAFGRPTSAASARSLRRSSISRSSPGKPTSAKRGVCRLGPAKLLVAAPAGAALRHDNARARLREVGGELLALENLRPDGNGEHCVVSPRAVRATAAARSAATRTQLLVRPHAREVAPPKVGDEHDVTAVAAVSPIGPAAGHVLLPAKVDRAVTAAARDCRQSCAIVEHRRNGTRHSPPRPTCAGAAHYRYAVSGRRDGEAARSRASGAEPKAERAKREA